MVHDTGYSTCGPASSLLGRRELLGTAGLAAGMCALPAFAAVPARHTGLLDVHHHIRPPGAPEVIAKLMAEWSPARAVADMDRCGVATGMAYPGPLLGGDEDAKRATARSWNEFGARLGQDHPGRFGLFASLPMTHVDNTVATIDFALDHLRADGFGIATSYGEAWLGDERFWPIYEKLDARAAVIFVHPNDANCCGPAKMSYNRAPMDGSWIEWPMNTARTIMSLMVSGSLRKFPRIRFIFAHGGGVMPLLIERIKGLRDWAAVGPQGLRALFPDGVDAELRKLYFECAQAYAHPNFDAARTLVPDSHLLFGSDYPIFPLDHATTGFADLTMSQATRRAIGRSGAAALLPRWA